MLSSDLRSEILKSEIQIERPISEILGTRHYVVLNPDLKFTNQNSNQKSKIANVPHSYLSATNGLTFVARRAGTRQATKATAASNKGTRMKIDTS